MRKYIYILMLGLMSCAQGTKDTTPTLSVSIEPQRKILEEIVGDRYEVTTVLANGANPETFDPSMSQRMAVERSEAYFTTGFMPFEQTLAQSLGDNVQVVNTSYGIAPVMGTHSHHHEGSEGSEHQEADPHVWTSIRNASVMADNMLAAMVRLDPRHETEYTERHHALKARLDSLDKATYEKLVQGGVHAFMVWHPSLSYYARDYGLHQIAVGQESKEQSISNLRGIIDEAREDSVKVFFFQKEYDSRQAESINREIGSTLVTINPLAYEWEEELDHITNALIKQ